MRDTSLDTLLALDGVTFFVDSKGEHQVRFLVKQVAASAERPHGLSYSLILLGKAGERLVGFDNAHSVAQRSGPSGGQRVAYDHRHRFRSVRPYDYGDAATLLADFWQQVDSVLREEGVLT